MDCLMITEMRKIFQGKEWRKATNLLENGYKGIFVILRVLRDSKTEIVSADLAKQLDVSTARIATALNTLQRKGYIKRIPSAVDRRKVIIVLTPLGVEALEAREKEVNDFVVPLFNKLSAEEQIMLVNLLKKLLQ